MKASEGVRVRAEKVLCTCYPKYCSVNICKVKAISRDVVTMNFVVQLKRQVNAVIYATKFFYQFSSNEYRPSLIDITTDYCALKSGLYKSIGHDALVSVFGNTTNMFTSCPIEPGEYYVKNFTLATHHFPSIFPAGRYITKFFFYNKDTSEMLGNTSFYFEIFYRGVLDLKMGWNGDRWLK